MQRPRIIAAVWFLVGLTFLIVGVSARPTRVSLVVIGVLFFIVGAATVLRRGTPPPPSA